MELIRLKEANPALGVEAFPRKWSSTGSLPKKALPEGSAFLRQKHFKANRVLLV